MPIATTPTSCDNPTNTMHALNLGDGLTHEFSLAWITDRQGDKQDNCPPLTAEQDAQVAKLVPLMSSGFYFIALINGQVRMLMEFEIGEGADFEFSAERFAEMAARQNLAIAESIPKIRATLPAEGLVVGAPPAYLCFGNRPTIWITMAPDVATDELAERLWRTTGQHFHQCYKALHPNHPLN